MPLYLITDVLDAYEAAQRTRAHEAAELLLDLSVRYERALDGDELEWRRIEALAADYDTRHPAEPSILAALHQPAAA